MALRPSRGHFLPRREEAAPQNGFYTLLRAN
jgi:hypothetical protein